MVFHQFHYPFSLRIPPRWKLIHGCLRCATVRLLTNSDHGLVPQGWRAWSRHREGEEAPRREVERIAMRAPPPPALAAGEAKTAMAEKVRVETKTKTIAPRPAVVAETTSAKTAVSKDEGKKMEEPAPDSKTKPEAKADTEHRAQATEATVPKAPVQHPAQAAKIPDAPVQVAKATVPPPPAAKQTTASH